MEERLAKYLAHCGVASRRESGRIVQEGRVMVNGTIILEPGFKVWPGKDHVKVDGKLLSQPGPPIYLVINKPRGVSSSVRDQGGRPTVISMLRGVKGRVLPVGGLEWDEEGVMLLTTNHTLAHTLNKPGVGISRTYLIKVKGIPDERTMHRMRCGVPIAGGRSLPMDVRRISVTSRNAWLQVIVRESRGNLLRWIMAKLRHPLLKVKRQRYGPLSVKGLAPGTFRKLKDQEKDAILATASKPPGLPERYSEEQELEMLAQAAGRGGRRRNRQVTREDEVPIPTIKEPKAPFAKNHQRINRGTLAKARARQKTRNRPGR